MLMKSFNHWTTPQLQKTRLLEQDNEQKTNNEYEKDIRN